MNDEEFGHITVDETKQPENKEINVPYLDYWRIRLDKSKLSDAQKEFYQYVKESIQRGEKIKGFAINPYLLLLRDDLIKKAIKVKDRPKIVITIKRLNRLYGFHDFTLDEILAKEAEHQRNIRIRTFKKNEPARWISPGETVDVNGVTLTRGGFYLGQYLKFSRYNATDKAFFKSSSYIEGPIINLSAERQQVDKELTRNYSTYLEMGEDMQQAMLNWLKGNATDEPQVLIYYLAGIEMRLLGDSTTTDDERRSLIQLLVQLLSNQSVTAVNSYYKLTHYISVLIDFTLARFFTDDAESVLPDTYAQPLPSLHRARIVKALSDLSDESTGDEDALISTVSHSITTPKWLPDVYRDAFNERLKTKLRQNLNTRNEWYDKSDFYYKAVKIDHGYTPVSEISGGLKEPPIKANTSMNKVVDKVITTLNGIFNDFTSFIRAKQTGAPPMRLARLLPRWCDPTLLSGVNEAIAGIKPTEGEKFRIVKLGVLLDTIGISHEQTLDAKAMGELNLNLYKIGLRVSTTAIRGTKLALDETVAVYDCRYGDVSNRGSLIIGLYLIAWMVGADSVKERDFNIVDQWLAGQSEKLEQQIPAMAAFRWLAYHKLTLSAKRKERAKQLIKFPKKRDELVKVLLSIVSDPDTTSAKRMNRLQTIYAIIGLNPDDIHSDLHRLATTASIMPKKATNSSSIDKSRLKEMSQSTQQAQEILSQVFADDNDPDNSATEPTAARPEAENITLQVLRLLINKVEWTRADFEALCKKQGETVGSMLERLNDYSYDNADEAVAEDDDDMIYIDTDVAKQLLK